MYSHKNRLNETVFLSFFIFFSIHFYAQRDYLDCTITFANDSVKAGQCTIPEFPTDNGIFFKKDNFKREYIKSSDIKRLEIRTNGFLYNFDFLHIAVFKKRHDSIVIENRKQWLHLKLSTAFMNTYTKAHSYKINDRE